MKDKISVGEKYIDCDGDEVQIVRIGEKSVVLHSEQLDMFVADIDDLVQDIASGELVRFE